MVGTLRIHSHNNTESHRYILQMFTKHPAWIWYYRCNLNKSTLRTNPGHLGQRWIQNWTCFVEISQKLLLSHLQLVETQLVVLLSPWLNIEIFVMALQTLSQMYLDFPERYAFASLFFLSVGKRRVNPQTKCQYFRIIKVSIHGCWETSKNVSE